VLDYLQAVDLQVIIKKYKFHIIETKYLGFIVSTKDIKMDTTKIKIIIK
jgi:hypothetical protein